MLRDLRQAGVYGLMVSIHAPDPVEHDAFTGVEGSFATATEVCRQARAEGMALTLNSVLSEDSLRAGRLGELMDLARSLDADFVQLIHPKPAGLWLGQKGMQSDPALIETIRQEHLLYNSGRRGDYPSLAAQVFEEAPYVLGCTAGGIDRFYVGADGEVQPCEFLNLSFGNVNREPFAEIFARMRAAFPDARCDWLCCTQAGPIAQALAEGEPTPLSQEKTEKLVAEWDRGEPTPVYRRLGIYRS
jgi:MoaA/NifB/PqqE/SkfB family radical SAM enzyme